MANTRPHASQSERPINDARALPTIADIGHLLLVRRAVREADRAETAGFVEAASPGIGLKASELENIDPAFLRGLDQLRPRAAADAIRARVKQADLLTSARQKRDDAAIVFGNGDFAIPEHRVCDERTVFGDCVKARQEDEQPQRRGKHFGDRINVGGCCLAKCEGNFGNGLENLGSQHA